MKTSEALTTSRLGGNDYEHARDVCTDAQGNAYVVGGTRSTNFLIVARRINKIAQKAKIE